MLKSVNQQLRASESLPDTFYPVGQKPEIITLLYRITQNSPFHDFIVAENELRS